MGKYFCKVLLVVAAAVIGFLLSQLALRKDVNQQVELCAQENGHNGEYHATAMVKSARHLTQVVMSAGDSGADGQIVSFKNLGIKVKKGDEVIECEYLKGKQVELAAVLQKAKLQKIVADETLKKSKEDNERYEGLRAMGATSEVSWLSSAFAFLKADLDAKTAAQEVIIADQRSSPYNFAAQFDGEVISVSSHLQKGFVVSKYAQPLELMRIANLAELEVTIEFPFEIKHRIESFTVMRRGDKKQGKLAGRQTGLEERDGKIFLTIGFENPGGQLKPFEAADVIVVLKK